MYGTGTCTISPPLEVAAGKGTFAFALGTLAAFGPEISEELLLAFAFGGGGLGTGTCLAGAAGTCLIGTAVGGDTCIALAVGAA